MERRLRGQFVCCDAGWQSADRPPAGSDGARLCPAERDQPSHFPASRAQGNDQAPPPFVAAAAGPMDTAALRGRAGSRRSLRPRSGRSTATGPRVQTPRAHGGGGRSADSLSAVSPTGSRQRVPPQVANLRHGRAPLCATVVTASRCRRSRSRRDAGRGGDGQSHTTHGRRWVSEGVRAGQRARGEDADPQIEVISECRCSFSCHRLSYQVPLQLPGRKSKLDRFQCFVERGDVL
jgi:hypothetical protein